LGRLRLCASCFETQKGKPAPSDDLTPFVVKKSSAENNNSQDAASADSSFAAPEGTPFSFLGKDGWAVCGHDAEGNGLSVAGCGSCNSKLPSQENDKTSNTDAAQK
jgi:hypothetical protein